MEKTGWAEEEWKQVDWEDMDMGLARMDTVSAAPGKEIDKNGHIESRSTSFMRTNLWILV